MTSRLSAVTFTPEPPCPTREEDGQEVGPDRGQRPGKQNGGRGRDLLGRRERHHHPVPGPGYGIERRKPEEGVDGVCGAGREDVLPGVCVVADDRCQEGVCRGVRETREPADESPRDGAEDGSPPDRTGQEVDPREVLGGHNPVRRPEENRDPEEPGEERHQHP